VGGWGGWVGGWVGGGTGKQGERGRAWRMGQGRKVAVEHFFVKVCVWRGVRSREGVWGKVCVGVVS
jgi:hypothetical protein